MTDQVEPRIEKMARALVKAGGADPDQLLQPGRPQMFGTPQGEAFAIVPEAATPMWRFYIKAAQVTLEIAQGIDKPEEGFTAAVEIKAAE